MVKDMAAWIVCRQAELVVDYDGFYIFLEQPLICMTQLLQLSQPELKKNQDAQVKSNKGLQKENKAIQEQAQAQAQALEQELDATHANAMRSQACLQGENENLW